MPRRAADSSFRAVQLDASDSSPLHRQLYDEIRRAILSGRLAAGTRLPATREFCRLMSVSRNTVLAAYEQLLAEGYVLSRIGAGTFVAPDLPERLPIVPREERAARAAPTPRRLSERGTRWLAAKRTTHRPDPSRMALRPGLPALAEFPMALWRRLTDRALRDATVRDLGYGEAQGQLPLREAIALYLAALRGARLTADQVVIVSGAQQAVELATRVLTDPGDAVWFEDPGYLAACGSITAHGARVVPVPVDDEGMIVERGIELAPEARLAYVTPSNQNPLGMTMSLARRVALSQWAERSGAWIIEDDNASEYRYGGRPIAALQGVDPHGRVLYAGTFSKVLLSGLRLGYLVAPPDLVPALVRARELTDRGSPGIVQRVLADFMREGHFGRHLRRMRTLYSERLETLLASVRRHGDGLLQVERGSGGMSRVVWLPQGIDEDALMPALREAGLQCMPLSAYRITPGSRGGLVCGFTSLDPHALDDAVRMLANVVRTHVARTARDD